MATVAEACDRLEANLLGRISDGTLFPDEKEWLRTVIAAARASEGATDAG